MSRYKRRKSAKIHFSGNKSLAILFCFIILTIGVFFILSRSSHIKRAFRTLTRVNYKISYNGEIFFPEFIVITLGDSVTVENRSSSLMEIAVGRHENHRDLQGFAEKIIQTGESFTFTPLEIGVFDIHDHLHPKKLGYLVIDE